MLAQCLGVLTEKGISIIEYLDEIWATYGFHRTEQISIRVANLEQVAQTLDEMRVNIPTQFAGYPVTLFEDLQAPTGDLPPTNALRFWLVDGVRIIVRPSGTEAKLKCYIEVVRSGGSPEDKASAEIIVHALKTELLKTLS
jgi:phosphomannomutase